MIRCKQGSFDDTTRCDDKRVARAQAEDYLSHRILNDLLPNWGYMQ